MTAYYNEFDPYAADWLENLIAAGHLPAGIVDRRSIVDVRPADLAGYTQCHFFAGIGGWTLALRMAGWPDDRPVWTGSCPCQPFSAAGKRRGTADARHLWPEFHRLIGECGPPTVFGEQVASKDGREWLAGVRADLEDVGYACGAADLCAASEGMVYAETEAYEWLQWAVRHCPDRRLAAELADFAEWAGQEIVFSAPHIRQRLYWGAQRLADATSEYRRGGTGGGNGGWLGNAGGVGFSDGTGPQPREQAGSPMGYGHSAIATGDAGFWSSAEWLPCTDGKTRRAQPGIFPLAHGVPNRVGRLRAYGNAIVPALAAEFIGAFVSP